MSNAKRPVSYKVICISIYHDDLANLDAAVKKLKERRIAVNRSSLIRYALRKATEADLLDWIQSLEPNTKSRVS